MAESHRYPLRIQQSKLDGWWFIFVDDVPELGVWGPNYEALLDRLKNEAKKLCCSRGENVTDIEIVQSEKPTLQVFHTEAASFKTTKTNFCKADLPEVTARASCRPLAAAPRQ